MPALFCKNLQDVVQNKEDSGIQRSYRLFGLLAIGIGGTLGSGVFSLVGEIASTNAGPASVVSLLLGTIVCLFTASSYVELSSRIPCSGSVYTYAYVGLGEVFSVIAAAGLTLEYAISGAAVAVSWGAKVGKALDAEWLIGRGDCPVAVAAVIIIVLCVMLLIMGVRESRAFTNIMTVGKCLLVTFMIVAALVAFNPKNLSPFVPPSMGVSGIMKGALNSFFGFIGFDEVCCMSGVAVNPTRTMPRAVIWSVVGVAIFTLMAAFSLVGMEPSNKIDPDAGFVIAFQDQGWPVIASITQIGEIVFLPLVVFISILPQCHLFKEMADDGLVPPIFGKVHHWRGAEQDGVLLHSNVLVGVILCVMAAFMDFDVLNDMISAGVLCSFILANTAGLMVRQTQTGADGFGRPLAAYVAGAALTAFSATGMLLPDSFMGTLTKKLPDPVPSVILIALLVLGLACAGVSFGALSIRMWRQTRASSVEVEGFQVPGGPLIPCIGILLNLGMLGSLSLSGCLICLGYFGVALLVYILYGVRNASARREARAGQLNGGVTVLSWAQGASF